MLNSIEFTDVDVIGEHERHLGQSLPAFLISERPALDEVCDHLISDLLNYSGKIIATLNGVAGDSGMYSSTSVLLDDNPSTRKRLADDPIVYEMAFATRQIVRCAQDVCVGHRVPFISTMIGIDNRDFFPPFMPVLRGEDGLVGAMLGSEGTGAYFAHLPFVLMHLPQEDRVYEQDRIQSERHIRVCDVLRAIIWMSADGRLELDMDTQMQNLGTTCIGLARLQKRGFISRMRWLMMERQRAHLDLLQRLSDESASAHWRADVLKRIGACRASLQSGSYHIPIDLPIAESSEIMSLLQRLIFLYGELIMSWPSIRQAARKLAEKGIRLGSCVSGLPSRMV